MSIGDSEEALTLLREIRDLLLPVADAHRDAYERRLEERELARREAVRALLSTDKRRAVWRLADGAHTQIEMSRTAGIAKSATSELVKELRALGALSDDDRPRQLLGDV